MLLLPLRITQGEPKRDLQPRPRYLFKLSLEEIGNNRIYHFFVYLIKSGFSLSPKKKKKLGCLCTKEGFPTFSHLDVTTFLYVYLDLFVLSLSLEFNIVKTEMECCLGPKLGRVCLLGAGFNSTDYLLHWKQQTSRSLVYFPETVSSKFNIPLWSISPLEGPFRYKRVNNIKCKEPKM